MKKVYYKGQPYDFKTTGNNVGSRHFQLFRNNILMRTVHEQELDKKSIVSILLDNYYCSLAERQSPVLG